jgi:hypothetical protein
MGDLDSNQIENRDFVDQNGDREQPGADNVLHYSRRFSHEEYVQAI